MSWNAQYQPPSGPPPGQFGFPSPNHYAPSPGPPPQQGGYNPLYNPSYVPYSGLPTGQFGFPQLGGVLNTPGYQPSFNPGNVPPSGPPLPRGPSSGPPPIPGNRPGSTYAPPSGTPSMEHRTSSGPGGGYPGQSYHQNQANNKGQGWQQNDSSYPGGAPINWNIRRQGQGPLDSNNSGSGSGSPGVGPGAWYQGPPGGQTGYDTGGPGGTSAMGYAHMPPAGQQHYGPSQGNNGGSLSFQYSICAGKKKALSVGINYFGRQGELRGCINDSKNICDFLTSHCGYNPGDILRLTDDATNPAEMPTRENILRAMQWLVTNAQPNDSLFFHYSGYGGQTKDEDGDEADGYDKVIYPMDFEHAGHIVDDDMHAIMVRPLPAGCRLTAIFDSAHSGSVLDLPYIYSTKGKIKEPNLLADKKAYEYARQTRTSPADVISWSGCKDSETSADTVEAGEATGAMSYALLEVLKQKPQQTYQELLNNVRTVMKNKYNQKPQLSSSHPMDTTILFIA